MNRSNIILTGFMGTGKSKVGRLIAEKLSMRFIDTDSEIEKREGANINNIFAKFGENYFRELERTIIREKSMLDNVVIATGVGTVLDKSNISILRNKGIIVHLKAKPEFILKNISGSEDRPVPHGEAIMSRIQNLLHARNEFYSDNDYEIDISDMTPEQAADYIIKKIIM